MAPVASSGLEILPVVSQPGEVAHEQEGGNMKSRLQIFCDICTPWCWAPVTLAQKITRALIWIAVAGLLVFAFVVLFPRVVNHVFYPWAQAMHRHLSPGVIMLLMFLGIVILPMGLLPKECFSWILAMEFHLWKAALVVQIGITVGAALQFWITRRFLQKPLEKMIGQHKLTKSVVLAVERAGTFKVTALLRLGPAPWGLENYALSYPESVRFWPYIISTFIFRIPHNICECYFGANLKTIGEILQGHHVPALQLAYQFVGLGLSFAVVVIGFIYGSRAMKQIEEQELAAKGQEMSAVRASSSTELMIDVGPEAESLDQPVHVTSTADSHTLTVVPEAKIHFERTSEQISSDVTLLTSGGSPTGIMLAGMRNWESPVGFQAKPGDLAMRLIDLDSESSSDCLDGPIPSAMQPSRSLGVVDPAVAANPAVQHSRGSSSIPSHVSSLL